MSSFVFGEILETGMLICFGIAWPVSIAKTLKTKTTSGKSLVFLLVILCGYLFGISKKILCDEIGLALIFYSINTIMVSLDILLWLRFNHIKNRNI
jgi:hypothetical protein